MKYNHVLSFSVINVHKYDKIVLFLKSRFNNEEIIDKTALVCYLMQFIQFLVLISIVIVFRSEDARFQRRCWICSQSSATFQARTQLTAPVKILRWSRIETVEETVEVDSWNSS